MLSHADFLTFSKNYLRNTIRVSNSLGTGGHSVGPDLSPNCKLKNCLHDLPYHNFRVPTTYGFIEGINYVFSLNIDPDEEILLRKILVIF